jgi:hypothetical protein
VSRGELTPEAKEIYLKSSGDHCPYYGATDLEGGAIEVDEGCAWQAIRCIECRTLWHDVYQLVDMVPADKVPGGPEAKRRRASGKPAAEVSSSEISGFLTRFILEEHAFIERCMEERRMQRIRDGWRGWW